MKQSFKDKLEALKGISPLPAVKTDAETIIAVRETLDRMYKVMLDYKLDYGIKWMVGLQKYLDDKDTRTVKWFNNHLSRGHVVEAELFGHFNKELTFAHPCVVLYDGSYDGNVGGWMLVAPISTPRFNDKNAFTVDLTVADGLKHDCGACLDSVQVIDKRRVIFQHTLPDGAKSKVRDIKLDEIDQKIIHYYLPESHNKYEDAAKVLATEQKEHQDTRTELNRLQKLNEELQQKLEKFEQSV
ncbi:type II toxin-antitoxin system PemK/MazF family toxin [Paenibacillus zanthoxyli]|uniref:type II toxin-antitoxin system PemK/MazF family toxin n=1 Tax=Paenibacillus zanthoxyli TaxID=369399 RepID=UPI000472E0DE|nr:type II toxin-antitoxin system PemK/MazF family toxin [Paenibacillus zanthoxyli]